VSPSATSVINGAEFVIDGSTIPKVSRPREEKTMTIKLPRIIKKYVDASNKHEVKFILACFSNDAVVRDERETLHGKQAIEGWIVKTIEKYKFKFKPLNIKDDEADVVVAMEVSGTFDGSPVTLDYHFTVENEKILSLTID
jgi:ketosteroid isomerase-like protein